MKSVQTLSLSPTDNHQVTTDSAEGKVSIIVPIYNVEKYLQDCVDSAINQTYRDIQIILVDDGSPDNCGEICDDYAKLDKRITVIHKENGGLSDARNSGLAIANGQWIHFLDSDDYLNDNTIEILVSIASHRNLDILAFDAISFLDSGCPKEVNERFRADAYIRQGTYNNRTIPGAELLMAFFENKDYRPPVQHYFFNRDFLIKNHLRFKKGIIHEDELFTFNSLIRAKRTAHIPLILYHHRVRPDSIMTSQLSLKNLDGMFAVLMEIINQRNPFFNCSETRSAYQITVRNITAGYLFRYYRLAKKGRALARTQLAAIVRELKAQKYFDFTPLRYLVRFRGFVGFRYACSKIETLKKLYHFVRKVAEFLMEK